MFNWFYLGGKLRYLKEWVELIETHVEFFKEIKYKEEDRVQVQFMLAELEKYRTILNRYR